MTMIWLYLQYLGNDKFSVAYIQSGLIFDTLGFVFFVKQKKKKFTHTTFSCYSKYLLYNIAKAVFINPIVSKLKKKQVTYIF